MSRDEIIENIMEMFNNDSLTRSDEQKIKLANVMLDNMEELVESETKEEIVGIDILYEKYLYWCARLKNGKFVFIKVFKKSSEEEAKSFKGKVSFAEVCKFSYSIFALELIFTMNFVIE